MDDRVGQSQYCDDKLLRAIELADRKCQKHILALQWVGKDTHVISRAYFRAFDDYSQAVNNHRSDWSGFPDTL
ncbi:MAG: hypothetical protein ACMXYF_00335 [Candidatus Woesearchaeota archaeon]